MRYYILLYATARYASAVTIARHYGAPYARRRICVNTAAYYAERFITRGRRYGAAHAMPVFSRRAERRMSRADGGFMPAAATPRKMPPRLMIFDLSPPPRYDDDVAHADEMRFAYFRHDDTLF